MEILDDVHLRIGLTHSFVYYSSCDVIFTDGTSWWYIFMYSNRYSFVTNGHCIYCIEFLTYFGSIFNGIIMIILDVGTWYDFIWIELSKGTKSTGTFEMFFSCFGPFWVWGVTILMIDSWLTQLDRTFQSKFQNHDCNLKITWIKLIVTKM